MSGFQKASRILVTCNRGLAPAIVKELTLLGYEIDEQFHTGVSLHGTLEDCIRLNLRLRCASQILYSLRTFGCQDPEQLYEELSDVPWEQWIAKNGYFTVSSNVLHETIRSGMFANVKVKDAVVDRIRKKTGTRPDTGAELLGAVVHLFWRNDRAEVFLDTSGDTLAKHGYRKRPGKAPLVEALAAGMLMMTHWDQKMPLVNPMCGSGTLAIEAALLATQRSPALFRRNFSVSHILGFDQRVFDDLRKEAAAATRKVEGLKIIASDISREAVEISKANAMTAGVDRLIDFEVCDFAETTLPEGPAIIIFNPEYGERLGEETELVETYGRIGDFMKQKCGGYWGYIFTGNLDLAKRVGLKTKRRMEFSTAQLDCRLLEYELYAGSRKPNVDSQ